VGGGPKRDKVTGDWRKMYNGLQKLYSSPVLLRRRNKTGRDGACSTHGLNTTFAKDSDWESYNGRENFGQTGSRACATLQGICEVILMGMNLFMLDSTKPTLECNIMLQTALNV
jgi:hypothetical protein